MTLARERRQIVTTLTAAGYPLHHIAAVLGTTETIVQRHLDAAAGAPALPSTRVVDDGPIGAGHIPHDPDRVAQLSRRTELGDAVKQWGHELGNTTRPAAVRGEGADRNTRRNTFHVTKAIGGNRA